MEKWISAPFRQRYLDFTLRGEFGQGARRETVRCQPLW
jgi:hypothetical protein